MLLTVVMEKTLERPLDFREIKPVNPKGNQPWIVFGRTCAVAVAPTSATWCTEQTLWKRSWCWERLRAGEERSNRGWDVWMASLTQCSAFFMVQLSHLHMTTVKTIALTIWILLKMMSLHFNTLSTYVIAFFPRSKYLLISWLHSPSAVILEPRKIKSATVSTLYPSICHEVMGPNAKIVVFKCWV